MIVLAWFLPLITVRRSVVLCPVFGIQGRPLESATVALRYRITNPPPRPFWARATPIGALTPVKARGEEKHVGPSNGHTGNTCGVRIPAPEIIHPPGAIARAARDNFIAKVKHDTV
jgi:hypothetical protein